MWPLTYGLWNSGSSQIVYNKIIAVSLTWPKTKVSGAETAFGVSVRVITSLEACRDIYCELWATEFPKRVRTSRGANFGGLVGVLFATPFFPMAIADNKSI